jgi:hypothetical protein
MLEFADHYIGDFPEDRFYVVRWLKDGGWHLYPTANGELPRGFDTELEARVYLENWKLEAIIVSGCEASKFPIPKRW